MGCSSSTDAASSESDQLFAYLAASPFFLVLAETQLRKFAELFRLVEFKAGDKIFEQGEPGAEFFVVAKGECDITCVSHEPPAHGKSSKAVQMLMSNGGAGGTFLCSKKKGDFFGEASVLSEDAIRSATVTATEDALMLVLSRASFESFMSSLDTESQARLQSVIGTRMIDSLREIDFLHSLDDMRLSLLANVFRYKTLQPGEVAFHEGDLGRDLYIISDGSVSVSAKSGGAQSAAEMKQNPRGSFIASSAPSTIALADDAHHDGEAAPDVQFATLAAGGYFGEVSLMIDLPRTATVRAITRCLLLVLNCADFNNFVAIVPGLREKFTTLASSRIAQQFKKFNVPFFQSIPEHRFKALSDLCRLDSFEKDECIFREGDETKPNAPAFYLVVSGKLTATKEGVGVVATLSPPQYFGEISLVTDSPRTATITAVTRCVLLSLTKESFEHFFIDSADDEGAASYAEFAIKLSQRQVPLKPVLQHKLGHQLFSTHIATEYSTENIAFYDASLHYESLSSDHQAEQIHLADELVSKFISADAATQINIPSHTREACLKEFRAGRITSSMFRDARHEIFKLMASDSFKRFKATPAFQQLLDAVGSYGSEKGTFTAHVPSLATHRASIANVVTTPTAAAASASASTSPDAGSGSAVIIPLQPQMPLQIDMHPRTNVRIHSPATSPKHKSIES